MRCASSTCSAPSRVRARRPKYLKDQSGTVDDLGVPRLLEIALLDRRDRAVHDHDRRGQAFCEAGNLVDFAFTDISRRPNFAERDQPRLDDSQVDGPCQTDRLLKASLRRSLVAMTRVSRP